MADLEAGVRRYHDARLHLDVVVLLPGFIYLTTELEYISTVLGTCIAVCLYDRERGFGGMNHFLLPQPGHGEIPAVSRENRYGNYAMSALLAGMQARGSNCNHLVAKMFGGAWVHGDRHGIGAMNRRLALDFLRDHGISLLGEHTGGNRAQQVLFDARCGHARVRVYEDSAIPDASPQEEAFIRRALDPTAVQANQPLQNPVRIPGLG